MFKFMKSKKGFTLVELMIVVVIMAILVAVAVPIFSAVTANAKAKTCIGNQRNIVSQINNYVMSDPTILALTEGASKTITITTNADGDDIAENGIVDNGVFTDTGKFATMFNEDNKPFCPEKNSVITVTVTAGQDSGAVKIQTSCGIDKHVL